jgi:hypothetical protein
VEEFSARVTLDILLPKILSGEHTWNIRDFRGKHDLIAKLPGLLRGYKTWMPEDYRIVVLVDRDRQDCQKLKIELENIATNVGLITKTIATGQSFQVLNRNAIEELEAWFLGDVEAIAAAYPGVPQTLAEQTRYRNPDALQGGTWEALEQVLQNAGYHLGGLKKVRAAREIAQYMNPPVNRSPSFQAFYQGLLALQVSVSG